MRAIHKLSDEEVEMFVNELMLVAELVNSASSYPPAISPDPDDDHVIQSAIAGQATVICTRDRHLLRPTVVAYCERHGIRIMNEIDLLAELRREGAA